MAETNVIFVTAVTPSEVGHGGQHRGYQIVHELQELVGPGQVMLFTKQHMVKVMTSNGAVSNSSVQTSRLSRWAAHRAGTAKRIAQNPYRLIQRTQFATGIHPNIRDNYESEISKLKKAVCVLEHTEFGDLIAVNEKYGVPTICCTQNLDAFSQNFELLSSYLSAIDTHSGSRKQKAGIYATAIDFANELQVMARCNERLFISKLETGFISGLGMTAEYYPYVPRGEIRNRQMAIRRKREQTRRDTGLFVLVGTAKYGPIRRSCEWFIDNVRREGLPEGFHVVVAGAGTDELLRPGESIEGLEAKGWVEQHEMDDLMARANAVVVPQRFGFGAPTRLAELSCAGVPVIGDRHPTYAIDPPPGFSVVDSSWANWRSRMKQLSNEEDLVPESDYLTWEAAQPTPLKALIKKLTL
jgi:glycosyltransferase involved in cell wall biosynthesis